MPSYVAALYSNGRVVTGCNHGDAFSKLSCAERDGEIESGFLDPATGRFFTEEYEFYLKQIFLIRHGQATGQRMPATLTPVGVRQVRAAAEFLSHEFDLAEFEAFTSPYLRCRHAASIIEEMTGLKFSIDNRLARQGDHEPDKEFLQRINAALADSPAKTIYISHCDFILNFAEQAIGHRITEGDMSGGSITFIDARRLVYCGKVCYACEPVSKSNVL